jgi:hypothetical protein
MTTKQHQLAMRLKAHALANYEDGWDTFVECCTDEDYLEFVGDKTTWEATFNLAKTVNEVIADRRADAKHYID